MLRSTFPLVFILVLQLPGTNGDTDYETVKKGDDIRLACEDVLPDQRECQLTNWIIGTVPRYTSLFTHGQKQTVSSSISLLYDNCSLVLAKVTEEQAKRYTCQQGDRATTEIQLFVAAVSQGRTGDKVTLTCSVTPKQCDHEVKWLNNNKEVTPDHPELTLSRPGCEYSVSFTDASPPSQFYQTLKCEVTQKHTNRLFILIPEPPSEDKTTSTSTPSSTASTSGTTARPEPTSPRPTKDRRSSGLDRDQTSPQTDSYLLKIVVPVVVILVLIAVFVVLMLWKRRKGTGDANKDTVKAEDGVTYASVQINQKNTRDRVKPQSREEESVTYSSVNVGRKTVDPDVTYASVNFDDNKKKTKQKVKEEENVTYSSVIA